MARNDYQGVFVYWFVEFTGGKTTKSTLVSKLFTTKGIGQTAL
jgi:hypothetical protein